MSLRIFVLVLSCSVLACAVLACSGATRSATPSYAPMAEKKSDPKRWVVAAMGAMDARPAVLIDTPVGPAGEPNGTQETDRSEDFCWLPDGALLMAQGSKFLRWDGRPRSGFKLFADLGELGGQIKRIAVSRDGTQLAFVVQQHAKNP